MYGVIEEGTEKVLKGRNNTGGGAAPVINITPIHKSCMGDIFSCSARYGIMSHLRRFNYRQTSIHRVIALCYIISSFQDFFSALIHILGSSEVWSDDFIKTSTMGVYQSYRVWKTLSL